MSKPKAKAKAKPKASQMVNLRIEQAVLDDFQTLADIGRRSRSNLMKFALTEYIAQNK
jgi:uncharacterized protein (DUF4415 family)